MSDPSLFSLAVVGIFSSQFNKHWWKGLTTHLTFFKFVTLDDDMKTVLNTDY
jgi:hypothetical protein